MEWRRHIQSLSQDAGFAGPASEAALRKIETTLEVGLPDELRALFGETDGVLGEYGIELIWSSDRILKDNVQFRQNLDYAELYMPFDCLLFFADAGNGDQFAYSILAGQIRRTDVFVWNHEDDSRTWVAPGLQRYLEWWLSGKLKV